MKARCCDRCKKFYIPDTLVRFDDIGKPKSIPIGISFVMPNGYCDENIDLCPDCMTELRDWLQKG